MLKFALFVKSTVSYYSCSSTNPDMPQLIGNADGKSHFEAVCASDDDSQLLAVGYTESSSFISSFTSLNGSMVSPSSHSKVAIAVLFSGTTMEASSIDTGYNNGVAVESDFDNAYLGCAGSTNKWALVAQNPDSIHVLDSSLTQDRIKGFYFSGYTFEIEPEQVFFMNTYIYFGATAPASTNRIVVFRMPSDGSSVKVTRNTSVDCWAMAYVG